MAFKPSSLRSHLYRESLELGSWNLDLIGWETTAKEQPVLLVPGHFCPRNFWFPLKRDGFGDWLESQGFYPFAIAESLQRSRRILRRSTSDWVFHILPLVLEFIANKTGRCPHVIGYSAGGAYALTSLSLLKPSAPIASLVTVGTQLAHHQEHPMIRKTLRALGRLGLEINGRLLGLPPSGNSAAELSEYIDAKAANEHVNNPLAQLLSPRKVRLNHPVLAISSLDDTVAPANGVEELFIRIEAPHKHLLALARDANQPPIRHFELFARRHQERIWPHILTWMRRWSD